MNQNREYERRFVPSDEYPTFLDIITHILNRSDVLSVSVARITQAYLLKVHDPKDVLRLRTVVYEGEIQSYMTFKGTDNVEVEREVVEPVDFSTLNPEDWAIVSKDRHIVLISGYGTFEIDHYRDSLDGVVVIEKEFDDFEEFENYTVPETLPFIGMDVTDNPLMRSSSLARMAHATASGTPR